ncbi:tyrosine-type recombinase/integrase [Streptomyces wuyuanensis]
MGLWRMAAAGGSQLPTAADRASPGRLHLTRPHLRALSQQHPSARAPRGTSPRSCRNTRNPPIRLHDLRHGAATLMLAADIDIKIVSDTLGHSDTRITRDIYQSVLPQVGRSAAEATAKLVPLQRKAEAEKAARKAAKKEKARKAAAKKTGEGKGGTTKDRVKAQAKAAKKTKRRKPKK